MKPWRYRPAADHELPPLAQLRSAKRESGLAGAIAHYGWGLTMRAYLTLAHRLAAQGREHLPAQAPFVLVANHTSHLDALVLAAALPWRLRRVAFPLAAGDIFFETPPVAFLSAMLLNALPMWRHSAARHALEDLRARLIGQPCGYILFPEGKRSRDGAMLPFKPGIGMMVAGVDVPVLPCHIAGAYAAWPPDAHCPRPFRITVRIGPALRFADASNDRAGWNTIAARIEEAVRALQPR